MARLVCALLLLAVATCSASESRIVGGHAVSIAQYPSMVQIQTEIVDGTWFTICSGNILTSLSILTTGFCMERRWIPLGERRVIAGGTYRNRPGVMSGVARTHIHPSYGETLAREGDIAVVILQNRLSYSAVIQQATIAAQGVSVPDNAPAVTAGWGVTLGESPDFRSESLQAVTVFTVNNGVCAANYANSRIPRTVTRNMICAGRPEGGAGACIGDSGGPLYYSNVVVGVVSFGLGCRNATFPRVYTAVSSYTNWIIANAI